MAVAGTENMRRSQLILVLLILYFICGMQCNDTNGLAAGGGRGCRLSRRGVGGGHGRGIDGNGDNSGSSNSGSGSGAEVPVLGAAAAAAGHHGSRGHSAASRHGYHLRVMLTTTAFSAAILVYQQ
ncbi:hypothetical protein MUK42_13575 [Musa troglodytarum]|uniref:Glycine-rich protein n=1 Tax=Musa troglodytarum TaxID=320322 RepID=A0A9E7I9B2_9LILI|nr:hypothetical protein MUK42_13575 [Musa troglodytarum]